MEITSLPAGEKKQHRRHRSGKGDSDQAYFTGVLIFVLLYLVVAALLLLFQQGVLG